MSCLTCASAALRDPSDVERDRTLRRMAALGAVNCTRSPFRASFHAPEHTCPRWTQAAPAVVQARQEWAQRRATA
jgi:hypothetical protein